MSPAFFLFAFICVYKLCQVHEPLFRSLRGMERCGTIEYSRWRFGSAGKRVWFSLLRKKGIRMEAKKKFIVNVMFYGIILLIVLLVCKYILPIMTPFVIAFIVSAIINAVVKRMHFKKPSLRRLVSILLCALIYGVIFVAVVLIGVKLVSTVADLIRGIPQFFSTYIMPWLEGGADSLETAVTPYDSMLASWIDEMASSLVKSLSQFVTSFSGRALVWITSSATAIPSVIVDIVIMVIASFFLVMDFDKVLGFLLKLVPVKQRELLNTSAHYTKTMVLVYIKSYSLLFMLTFVELTIGFLLLRIPNAVVLALAIAVFDLMPVLGTGGILLPWVLGALLMKNYVMAFGILALYLVITGIRNTLEPRIVGKQIGLHPLATLAAMLLGLRLFGLVGMFALPIALTVANAMTRTRQKANTQKKEETASAAT